MVDSYQHGRGLALARAAEAMLRTLGGSEVCVRYPIVSNSALAEFGIAQVATSDVPISPVMVRSAAGSERQIDVLISAGTMNAQIIAKSVDSAEALFALALGIVHDGRLWRIVRVTTEWFAGTPYLYRLICE